MEMVIRKSFRSMLSALMYGIYCQTGQFLVARLEAPLIALALFVVQVNLLGDAAPERFLLSWLGVVILTWTAKSIFRVDEVRLVHEKIGGAVKSPALLSVGSRAASLFVEFLLDLLIIGCVLFVFRGYSAPLIMVAAAVFVICTQAAVNGSIFVLHFYLSRWLNVKNIMAVIFMCLAIMSPVVFMFDDLDSYGQEYFTSLNPAAHFLAAYYNIFWFGTAVSFQVLPFILAFSVAFVWVCVSFIGRQSPNHNTKPDSVASPNSITFGRYVGRGSITGMELFFNLYAIGPHSMLALPKRTSKLMEIEEFKDQLIRGLSTYSRLNDLYLDLLLTACLSGSGQKQVALPDEKFLHLTEARLESLLGEINAIMNTNLTMERGQFETFAD